MNHNRWFCSSGALVVRHFCGSLQILDEGLHFTVTNVFTECMQNLYFAWASLRAFR